MNIMGCGKPNFSAWTGASFRFGIVLFFVTRYLETLYYIWPKFVNKRQTIEIYCYKRISGSSIFKLMPRFTKLKTMIFLQ